MENSPGAIFKEPLRETGTRKTCKEIYSHLINYYILDKHDKNTQSFTIF